MMKLALHKSAIIALSAISFSTIALNAKAVNLVTNGDFETNTGNGQIDYNTTVTGWSNATGTGTSKPGYNFVFNPDPNSPSGTTADTTGAVGDAGTLKLWGPGTGSPNGLTVSPPPDGGAFLGLDGAYQTAPVSQSISGLTIGQQYYVSFDYAGAQQSDPRFTGPTTEGFQVSFGGATQATPILSNVGEGFTGWKKETFAFTATAATQTLSFLAVGTPNGQPPFSLLDSVSVEVVPEAPVYIGALVALGLGAALRVKSARKK